MKVWIRSILFRIRTSGGALVKGTMKLQVLKKKKKSGNLMIG